MKTTLLHFSNMKIQILQEIQVLQKQKYLKNTVSHDRFVLIWDFGRIWLFNILNVRAKKHDTFNINR